MLLRLDLLVILDGGLREHIITFTRRLIMALAAPSALSVNYCEGVFGQDNPLRFVPSTLDDDHRYRLPFWLLL